MKTASAISETAEARELSVARSVPAARDTAVTETSPTFTLTFAFGTPMSEIEDHIIRVTLDYTQGNRLRAAQLLQIHPRTIRRHLGKKEARGSFNRTM